MFSKGNKRGKSKAADKTDTWEKEIAIPSSELNRVENNPRLSAVFSKLIDVMDIAFWELDLDYRVVSYNQKAKQIYGENIIGKRCFELAAGLNHVCPDCPAQKVYEGASSGRSEHMRTDVAGKKIYIDHIATPIKDDRGKLVGSLVLIVDITQRKRMERTLKKHHEKLEKIVADRTKALKKSEERFCKLYNESKKTEAVYRSFIHSSADAIVIYDLEGRVKYASPVFSQIFGWSLAELRGKRIPYVPDSEKDESARRINDVIRDGKLCQNFETKRLTKNGDLLDVSISASMFTDHEGNPAGMLVILRDISERRIMETQIRQSQKMEALGALAGGVAHDFNNILGIILGNSDLALAGLSKDPETAKLIEGIRTASLRARDVVKQLLDFSRKSEEKRNVINISPIVRESLKLLRSTIPSNVEFKDRISRNVKSVMAEPTQIHQILINLCTNASHAMADRGGVLEIDLDNAVIPPGGLDSVPELSPGEYVRLSVKDEGQGISTENMEHIFEPYFTTKNVGKGTGMGLAVVHGIVKNHEGEIKVSSILGQGSTFDIYLPAVKAEKAVIENVEDQYPTGNESVLVVDDDVSILLVEKELLKLLGYQVETYENPETALEKFRENPTRFDVVIADMTMPKMFGDEFLKRVMKLNPGVSTILCTGYSEKIDEIRALDLGIDRFMMKPLKLQKLAGAIRKLIDEKKT